MELSVLEMVGRVMAAAACGAAVGWEREAKGRAAGLRTHMLVALGSVGFTLVAWRIPTAMPDVSGADPVRILGGIVGGVGFLGAGAIMRTDDRVRGLTTAASIWAVATVGVAAGIGYYELTGVLIAMILLTLVVVRWIEPSPAAPSGHDAGPDDAPEL